MSLSLGTCEVCRTKLMPCFDGPQVIVDIEAVTKPRQQEKET